MTVADDVIATARAQLGKPYSYGAAGPDWFDCSGLIHFCFAAHGIEVGRDTADQQLRHGVAVAPGDERPGDCAYFGDLAGPRAHGGILVARDQMIDAPHTGAAVRYDSVSGWSASGEALRGYRRFVQLPQEADMPLTADDLARITEIAQEQIANACVPPDGAIFKLQAAIFNNQVAPLLKKIIDKLGA